MNGEKFKLKDHITWLLSLSIGVSVLSQIEPLAIVMKPLMHLLWLLSLFALIASDVKNIRLSPFTKVFLCTYGLYLLYCGILTAFGQSYLNGNFLRVLPVPLLVSIIADLCSDKLDKKSIERLMMSYVLFSLLYGIYIHVSFFPSYTEWLKCMSYAYDSKNTATQIWAVAGVLLLLGVEYRNVFQKVIGCLLSGYLLFICCLTQGRTVLLAIACAYLAFVLLNAKKKLRWIICSIIAACLLWAFIPTRRFILHTFLVDLYSSNQMGTGLELNAFSSGRLGHYKDALLCISQSPVIGTGKYYVDNLYIAILAESGIIGLLLILPVLVLRALQNLFVKAGKRDRALLLVLTTFYAVESVLEGYPPLGPGVCSMMFWFVSIYICNHGEIPKQLQLKW